MIGYYIFIVLSSVLMGCGFSMWFIVYFVEKSNQSGDSRGQFYDNTKQPMRIYYYSVMEELKEIMENREEYDILKH